jgi:hypothetical protein
MTDARWLSHVEAVTAGGQYRFSVNQLYLEWQRPRVKRVGGAWMRAQAISLAVWVALAQPSAALPLSGLWGGEALGASPEGRGAQALVWALLAALALAALPWGLLARPLSPALLAALPPARPWLIRALRRLRRGMSLTAWVVGWGGAALVALSAALAPSALPWAHLSAALAAPLLVGLAAAADAVWAERRAGRLRFMHHLNLWRARYPLHGYLSKPRLQVPHEGERGALYDYEVRRLLVVDQDLTVDLLAKNGIHKRLNLLILSLQQYPKHTAKFARRILAMHPDEVEVCVLHHEGRDPKRLAEQLKALGVTKRHKVRRVGWTQGDLALLEAHLGFSPLDWDTFAVDSVPPRSLLEGVVSSIELGVGLIERLAPGLRALPAPPPQARPPRPRVASSEAPSAPPAPVAPPPSQGSALEPSGGAQ